MSEKKKITGVLGIGNLLLKDEGFGVHVIRYLEENYRLPEEVLLQDGGTAGIYMAPFLEEVDNLIVVDVIGVDAPAGTVHRYNGEELRGANLQMSMSPHQLGLLEILEICKLRDQEPEHVEFIGIVPAEIDTWVGLSDTLSGKEIEVAEMVVAMLCEKGLDVRKVTS
ncbi:MAG: HyaD/HybD family hydrogenase maturation endopeptidase [Desulfobulbaceae bacterium]|nr:HyaD/HybD family hydrogenase maturation endopeptidase [Desulfobulbaceae bacterium]